ncbi:MAG: hypothetical protein ACEQSR_01455 [Candidatus Methylacidiphilales bacterium]
MMNEPITPAQLKQLHVLLNETKQTAYKQDLMDYYCIDGRFPTSSVFHQLLFLKEINK